MPRVLSPLFALALIACGTTPDLDPAEPIAPRAVLGTGLDIFAPLAAGETLRVEAGLQGGYHLTVNLRVQGVSAHPIAVNFKGTIDGSDEEACSGGYADAELVARDPEWLELPAGARCFVRDPARIVGERVLLTGAVSDGTGSAASDQCEILAGEILRPH